MIHWPRPAKNCRELEGSAIVKEAACPLWGLHPSAPGVVVKFPSLFKPRWRHPKAKTRLAAMAHISDPETLYKIATQSQDERLRLEAAHRLNDPTLLFRLARTAIHADIRFEAALLIRDEATLAVMALDAWDIEHGKLAVIHIDNHLLLRRLVRSAQLEAIRLAAAIKLNDPDMIRQVAQSAHDVHSRWQAAKHLDDPKLLADVACVQRSNTRAEAIQKKARCAFIHHIERCQQQSKNDALCRIVKSVPHVPLMLEAFVRIATNAIPAKLITHLSRQDFSTAEDAAIQRMLKKIEQAGWRIQKTTQAIACHQCHRVGRFSLRIMSSDSAHIAHDHIVCPGCGGLGQQWIHLIAFRHPLHPHVIFRLPTRGPTPSIRR